MLVSAITMQSYNGYNMANNKPVKSKDIISDTSFNSLTPYINKKSIPQEYSSQLFENINEWQRFCHNQILGNKLNIIA